MIEIGVIGIVLVLALLGLAAAALETINDGEHNKPY